MTDYLDDPVYQDIALDERKRQRVEARRRRHPDCRDPDHPGCMWCEPEDFLDPDEEPLDGPA